MIIDEELYKRIFELEKRIKQAEEKYGPDDIHVAEELEACAYIMKKAKTRLLEASNLSARAQKIRREYSVLPQIRRQQLKSVDEGESAAETAVAEAIPVVSYKQQPVDASWWDGEIVVHFPDTGHLPNCYTSKTEVEHLEILAYAYENEDPFARAAMTEDDLRRVWGWIVRHRTGRYPETLSSIDQKAKRLRRRQLGPAANVIDCTVTPEPILVRREPRPSSKAKAKSVSADDVVGRLRKWLRDNGLNL